jgi:hypothetical protein
MDSSWNVSKVHSMIRWMNRRKAGPVNAGNDVILTHGSMGWDYCMSYSPEDEVELIPQLVDAVEDQGLKVSIYVNCYQGHTFFYLLIPILKILNQLLKNMF